MSTTIRSGLGAPRIRVAPARSAASPAGELSDALALRAVRGPRARSSPRGFGGALDSRLGDRSRLPLVAPSSNATHVEAECCSPEKQ